MILVLNHKNPRDVHPLETLSCPFDSTILLDDITRRKISRKPVVFVGGEEYCYCVENYPESHYLD